MLPGPSRIRRDIGSTGAQRSQRPIRTPRSNSEVHIATAKVTYEVLGPFEIPRTTPKRGGVKLATEFHKYNTLKKTDFWKEIAAAAKDIAGIGDLDKAKGVYVFALRVGRGTTPYYVGKSGRQALVKEAFNSRNILAYDDCISSKKGIPVMFFVVLRPRRGPDNRNTIDSVERFFIEMAYARNPEGLINVQHAKEADWSVAGVIRSDGRGRPSRSALEFKRMMHL